MTSEAQKRAAAKWRAANPDKVKTWGKAYRQTAKRKQYMVDYSKKWYEEHKEEYKAYHAARCATEGYRLDSRLRHLKKVGLSHEEIEKARQAHIAFDALPNEERRCAACGRNDAPGKLGWAFDHCHKTLTFRGIVHDFCNVGLGHFKDDPDRMRMAAEYVANFEEALCLRV